MLFMYLIGLSQKYWMCLPLIDGITLKQNVLRL
jgi:hypothetical protein